jgi:plasmid stabilization system protein ParE
MAFIQADNPAAAVRAADYIRDTANALGRMATGRRGRFSGTYEKSVIGLPYVIVYEVMVGDGHETIFILRVIHTSRNWPPGGWPQDA